MYQNNHTDEIQHHGIPGMKWGIRRYQNKDGSLTPAGRKRAAKLEDQYKKVTGRNIRKQIAKNQSAKPKTLKEMTNEELKSKTTRLRLENDYTRESNNYQSLHPQKVSLGKRFITHVGKNVISPAATEAGKRYLTDYLSKIGKSETVDPMDKLKREVETLELQKRKAVANDYFEKRKEKQHNN